MKTMIHKGDRILWIFLASTILMLAVKITRAQTNAQEVLKIKISGNGFSDETFVRFKADATEGFEGDKDAWKMFSMNPAVPMIFTRVDGYPVSLNTLPVPVEKINIDLFTKINYPGIYNLEASIVSPFPDTVKIFLYDEDQNLFFNLSQDSLVNLFLEADSGVSARFRLLFYTPVSYHSKSLTCFKNKDGEISINNLSDRGWKIDITDENNIFQQSITGMGKEYSFAGLHGGVYSAVVRDFSDTAEFEIAVSQPMPVLSSFEMSSTTVCLCDGGFAGFNNTSVGAATYSWQAGDGATSEDFNFSHAYLQPGEYIVTLAVSDGQCADTSYAAVNVVENVILNAGEAGIKEEVPLTFDGENYILKSSSMGLEQMQVEVFNLLGQSIRSNTFVNAWDKELIIRIYSDVKQAYLFRFVSNNTSFTKLTL